MCVCVCVLFKYINVIHYDLFRKHISSIAFSPDGKHLAAGECGHQPCVRVWDVASRSVLSEVQGHSFGISCLVSQRLHSSLPVGSL